MAEHVEIDHVNLEDLTVLGGVFGVDEGDKLQSVECFRGKIMVSDWMNS